jgi:hypothetical protein
MALSDVIFEFPTDTKGAQVDKLAKTAIYWLELRALLLAALIAADRLAPRFFGAPRARLSCLGAFFNTKAPLGRSSTKYALVITDEMTEVAHTNSRHDFFNGQK